jgi:tetratricopeptide (TPR) repeat protein
LSIQPGYQKEYNDVAVSGFNKDMLPNHEYRAGSIPAGAGTGLAGRALLGWMDREQAARFLMEDCLFSTPLTFRCAEEIWESRKAIVENLREDPFNPRKLPLSAADLKAARRFRSWHPGAESVVDFVRLNPMDLVVHQLWVSTDIADTYRDKVTPDKWLHTALLDPPSHSRLKWRRDGNTIVFDVPHFEFFLAGPLQPDAHMRVSEVDSFVTVALHGDRALLLRGYHRTFACAHGMLGAVNAPHGVLFGVSNDLESMGSGADDVRKMMKGPRPPRMGDFCDDRLFLPVTLRRRRYQLRIRCEMAEVDEEEAQTDRHQDPLTTTPVTQASGQIATAKGSFRNPDAVGNVRSILDSAMRHRQAGRLREAVTLYERVLFLRPDHADAHTNLGQTLIDQGKHNEAMSHCERALAVNPDSPEAHNNLGFILKDRGEFDGAMGHFAKAIAIKPDFATAHFNRAELKIFHHGDTDLAALEALVRRDGLSAEEGPLVHFALAKALDDIGDYGRAFEHLRKGNDLKRGQIDYDEKSEFRLFERISTVYDGALFDRFRGTGDPSPVPIFVLGMPRSGSTLIEQILASHPQIHGAGELRDLDTALSSVLSAVNPTVSYPECIPALAGDTFRRIGEAYLARLAILADRKARIVDKLPGNFLDIGLIRLILPNARIIHTVRDPIDTCVSCYSKLFAAGQYFSYDLGELGRYYRCYSALMAHWRSVLPPASILDVSYEDVVDDLEGQARRLIDYCGLPWDDRCLSFHKTIRPVKTASTVQVRQPLFRSSLQRWRRYQPSLGPLLQELGDVATLKARAAS